MTRLLCSLLVIGSVVAGDSARAEDYCPQFYYGQWNGVHFYLGKKKSDCNTTDVVSTTTYVAPTMLCPNCPDVIQTPHVILDRVPWGFHWKDPGQSRDRNGIYIAPKRNDNDRGWRKVTNGKKEYIVTSTINDDIVIFRVLEIKDGSTRYWIGQQASAYPDDASYPGGSRNVGTAGEEVGPNTRRIKVTDGPLKAILGDDTIYVRLIPTAVPVPAQSSPQPESN